MNHKSWVTSHQFPNQNLAGQMILTTFYCISVLGQNNLIEQLSEGLAKQFIKLDVISGIKQELRPLSVLVFSHADFQDFMKFWPTNWLLQVGYSWRSTSWMTTWLVLRKLNNSPSPVASTIEQVIKHAILSEQLLSNHQQITNVELASSWV